MIPIAETIRSLRFARTLVKDAIEAAETEQHTRVSLFLETHYPFFQKAVQKILMERRPGNADDFYPVDAYLWTEQRVWASYAGDPLTQTDIIEDRLSFYMLWDVKWCCRLTIAIADCVEGILMAQSAPARATHESRLQVWANLHREPKQRPSRWLGLELKRTQLPKQPSQFKNSQRSIRVTASMINRTRRRILSEWLPCWRTELVQLNKEIRLHESIAQTLSTRKQKLNA